MYKDNSKIDVELLAEVGHIAHRLRTLDTRLASILDDPRYQQESQHCQTSTAHCSNAPKPDHQCTSSSPSSSSERRPSLAAQLAQDIGDRISASAGDTEAPQPSQPSQQRRYSCKQVEDIILEFYEKHLIYHQNQEKERLAAISTRELTEPRRSRIYRLTSGDPNNMSQLPTLQTPSKCSSSNSGENADNQISEDNLAKQTASKQYELTTEPSGHITATASGKRNSIANQPMPEIQISSSDEQPKTRKSLSEQCEPRESTVDSTSEGKSAAYEPTATTTGGTCGHYCAGWQTSIWSNQLDDDVLRTLIMELKHKIEFTERMNWLCKYHLKNTIVICHILFVVFCHSS